MHLLFICVRVRIFRHDQWSNRVSVRSENKSTNIHRPRTVAVCKNGASHRHLDPLPP